MASLLYQSSHDPLPLYTPRQAGTCASETSSILSSAPSYTSDAPSYHSSSLARIPSCHESEATEPSVPRPLANPTSNSNPDTRPIGLPRLEYAPGFRRSQPCRFPILDISSQDPMASAPSPHTSSVSFTPPTCYIGSRICERRVAADYPSRGRRALALTLSSSGQQSRQSKFGSLSSKPLDLRRSSVGEKVLSPISPIHEPSLCAEENSRVKHGRIGTPGSSQENPTGPISPHEDPELVGPEAAAIARDRRLYMANAKKGLTDEEMDMMRAHEAKTWDHLIAQMSEWEERDRNWNIYKRGWGNERRRTVGSRLESRRL